MSAFPIAGPLSLNSRHGRELRVQWALIRCERKEICREMHRRKDLKKHRQSLRKRKAPRT
ncbi:hypothetical protein DT385_00360 [Pseudomonas syringae]|nr:hypothetical protein DT385_00360 [Pseudomonas syringae]